MKIPMEPRRQATSDTDVTDLTALQMRNPLAASVVQRLLGKERVKPQGKTAKERIDDWHKLYFALGDLATLDELQACIEACPDLSLPAAVDLRKRLLKERQRLETLIHRGKTQTP